MNVIFLSTNYSLQKPLMCVSISSRGVVKVELYNEDYITNYIAKKKQESYNYLQNHKVYEIELDENRKITRKGKKNLCVCSSDIFDIYYSKLTMYEFNEAFKLENEEDQTDVIKFFLIYYEDITNKKMALIFKEKLKEYITNHIGDEFTNMLLTYLTCVNFDKQDKYIDELIDIYLRKINSSDPYFKDFYLLLSLYVNERKIDSQMNYLKSTNENGWGLKDELKLFVGLIKSHCALKKEIELLKENKKNEERVSEEYSSSEEEKTLISDSNSHNSISKTVKVSLLHNSKISIDQTIRDTLSTLNYDNKDELKKQLTELKQMIESLNESNLFYNQRDEMVSLDNYESEDNQKQLLKFIDFYLK